MYRILSSTCNTEYSGHKTHCSSQITRSILTAKNNSSDICEYSRNSSCDLFHTTEQRFFFRLYSDFDNNCWWGPARVSPLAGEIYCFFNSKVDPASFFLIRLSPAAIPRLPRRPLGLTSEARDLRPRWVVRDWHLKVVSPLHHLLSALPTLVLSACVHRRAFYRPIQLTCMRKLCAYGTNAASPQQTQGIHAQYYLFCRAQIY